MKLESSTKKTRALAIGLGGMGSLILYLTKIRPTTSPPQSAFWLGVSLFVVGVCVYLFDQSVTIEILDNEKCLKVRKQSVAGTSEKRFPFDQISHVKTQRVGTKPPRSYHMIIHLKDGSKIRTGRWAFNENEVRVEASEFARRLGVGIE